MNGFLMPVSELTQSTDWVNAFDAASPAQFVIEDVAVIVQALEGENEEYDWIIYGLLENGKWFCLHAGCGYTGWEYGTNGSGYTANSDAELISMCMTSNMRLRFGLSLPDERVT